MQIILGELYRRFLETLHLHTRLENRKVLTGPSQHSCFLNTGIAVALKLTNALKIFKIC
jgi:hypothetical protein